MIAFSLFSAVEQMHKQQGEEAANAKRKDFQGRYAPVFVAKRNLRFSETKVEPPAKGTYRPESIRARDDKIEVLSFKPSGDDAKSIQPDSTFTKVEWETAERIYNATYPSAFEDSFEEGSKTPMDKDSMYCYGVKLPEETMKSLLEIEDPEQYEQSLLKSVREHWAPDVSVAPASSAQSSVA